jgi:pyruvate/2-oxoglutarate dehydrogenase complex dihydrolipoamide acyltransferase (E2) component
MAIEIVLPQIGAATQPGKVVRWFAAEGESIREGDPLYVVEVSGTAHEVEAPGTGTLRINAALGQTYQTGTVLGLIELRDRV